MGKIKDEPWMVGLLQALGVGVYIALVVLFFLSANYIFPESGGGGPHFFTMAIMLILITMSVAVVGTSYFRLSR